MLTCVFEMCRLISKAMSVYEFSVALRSTSVFFFFQAEDGIRDHCVTGVQTCALPIFTEMDLDEVLARRPQLALVDELAHTNAPGSRHPKRWQDIQELLDAGIDVFTDRKSVV